jgi:hypothetical protein
MYRVIMGGGFLKLGTTLGMWHIDEQGRPCRNLTSDAPVCDSIRKQGADYLVRYKYGKTISAMQAQ